MRAIASIQAQSFCDVQIIVSVNGESVDEELFKLIGSRERIVTVRNKLPSQQNAMALGRDAASTDSFCFLDDDDELGPTSIARRFEFLQDDAECDAVATDGFRGEGSGRRLVIDRKRFDNRDLFGSLLQGNWNASCATLFRSSRFDGNFFSVDYRDQKYGAKHLLDDRYYDHGFSWTFCTAKMLFSRNVSVIDDAEYVIHDTAQSESKSLGYQLSVAAVWCAIRSMRPPSKYMKMLKGKLARAYHSVAERYRNVGDMNRARMFHRLSLGVVPQGLVYVPYTRKVVASGWGIAALKGRR